MDEYAIEVRSLRMAYGHTEVVHGIDLDVRAGEVFAILGPNGAGKTSTIEILEGFRQRTAGAVRVLDSDPEHGNGRWRERIGVVLQSSTPEADLSVRETLRLYAGFYERPAQIDSLLELCGLTEQADVRNRRLSGGQQRRLDVALALVGSPELLFLDEPTTGFDPVARRAAWAMIEGLRADGTTIVLTTHYLDEAEALADRLAVIDRGLIVAQGTAADLGGRDQAETRISFTLASATPVPRGVDGVDGRFSVRTNDPTRRLLELTSWAVEHDLELGDLTVTRPSLEDVYFRLTAQEEPVAP